MASGEAGDAGRDVVAMTIKVEDGRRVNLVRYLGDVAHVDVGSEREVELGEQLADPYGLIGSERVDNQLDKMALGAARQTLKTVDDA